MKASDISCQAVIMCGISGSGKTRFAMELERNGYRRLSTDAVIWNEVGERLFRLPGEEQSRLFARSRQLVRARLLDLLKSGEKVVVDATHCRRSARDEMRRLCAEAGVEHLFIYCRADLEELWRRLSLRKGTGPDDLIVTREELERYWAGFERPQPDETDIIEPAI